MEPQDDYLPEALLGRLVDYESATVITQMMYPPKPVLVVIGEKPRPGMEITLRPVTYIQQPAFWEIHVVGSPGSLDEPPVATQLPAEPPPPVATQLPAESTSYSVELDLANCTGTIGIEVVGATQAERIVVPSTAAEE
jgi:hypothetical protein